ncbi:ATP-binding protein [Streptomyces rimosus]|uniref:ATP-binding protein n=1 Tax=Streptomyces rimosus TaxID=1927 RepID=UPI0005188AC8|nr:ATP-binding protein [Streptomyces rimosus]
MASISDAVNNRRQRPAGDDFGTADFSFAPATREKAKARFALMGVSGSGKTWTGLRIAHGLNARFAVIDTERGAASKYAGINGISFDTLQLTSFDPRNLIKALAAAAAAGYGAVLVDSLSHFWSGTDGTLEQVDKAAKERYGKNTFGGWKEGTPLQNSMVDALLSYPGHVVATMRSHTEWSLERNGNGSLEPKRIGTRPEQRRGVEYEFDVVAQMDVNNTLSVIKSRCPALHGQTVEQPDGKQLAATLLDWLNDGATPVDPSTYIDRATADDATYDGLLALYGEVESRGLQATPMLDPATGDGTSLGDYIRTRGTALRSQ